MAGVCGIACEVCGFKSEVCDGGCISGTDPKAPERAEKLRKLDGEGCPMLECAIKNKVDYCLRCEKFPCDIHYQEFLYSKKALDSFEETKQKLKKFPA